ncbi:hypothetical protein EYF80_009730 [Liparis tanakae]|uniref:Uncharacterized protein n=1 Tax=Liparis tanakae TaxID=230148 RepID=A0A4Z2IR32_9TELE|nr:hypothetical protein EYF80_009730 [Liparis tanakae]
MHACAPLSSQTTVVRCRINRKLSHCANEPRTPRHSNGTILKTDGYCRCFAPNARLSLVNCKIKDPSTAHRSIELEECCNSAINYQPGVWCGGSCVPLVEDFGGGASLPFFLILILSLPPWVPVAFTGSLRAGLPTAEATRRVAGHEEPLEANLESPGRGRRGDSPVYVGEKKEEEVE